MYTAKLISVNNESNGEFFDEVEVAYNGETVEIVKVKPAEDTESYNATVKDAGCDSFEWIESTRSL